MVETLIAPYTSERFIKNSRFLAHAMPVKTTKEAKDFITSLSITYPDATHHCWAWQIGPSSRCYDAGEPSGTAGKPILQAIISQKLDHVVLIISRWFGGIKLGASGLIRAYSGTATECLRHAPKELLIERIQLSFHCPFSLINLLQARLLEWHIENTPPVFDAQGAFFILNLPIERREEITHRITDLTHGKSVIKIIAPHTPNKN
ncbi:MAG: YigZ family protein [Acetobacter sp.]|nr:YigZ family protein [Acetobacter sp.]